MRTQVSSPQAVPNRAMQIARRQPRGASFGAKDVCPIPVDVLEFTTYCRSSSQASVRHPRHGLVKTGRLDDEPGEVRVEALL